MSGPSNTGADLSRRSREALAHSIAGTALAERVDPESVVSEVPFRPPSTRGTAYRIIVTDQVDAYDEPMSAEAGLEAARAAGDSFSGSARRAAKLSIADAPVENFADLRELIATLPSTTVMVNHQPRITTKSTSKRAAEERRNVRLRVWLYAASREDDNDFHLILGRQPGATPSVYMTMELSGLPTRNSAAFDRLKAVRDAFKQFFGNNMPGMTYQFYDPPIPVEIEGSLFFDMSHSSGSKPGPPSLRDRMPTIWEVHPVSRMIFEP
jgi:hypothetical protein